MKAGNIARLRGNLLMLLTAIIWGTAFVAQKDGGDQIGALTFNGVRSAVGAIGLLLMLPLLDRFGIAHKPADAAERKNLWIGGVLCGLALFAATNLQQVGILYTSVGKSGFITALYIVLVPLLGLFFGKRTTWMNWVGVAVSLAGLYLLCGRGESGFAIGDVLLLLCALMFSVQILIVSHYSPLVDGVRLSCIQFAVVAVLNVLPCVCFERPSVPAIVQNWLPVLYAGLLSSGVAYTLQILAQRDTDPTTASLLMSLESVFAALAGWLILHDHLSLPEVLGCVLMFIAIVLAQLPAPQKGDRS